MWLVWHYDYGQSYVVCAFTTKKAAVAYIAERQDGEQSLGVEGVDLRSGRVDRVTQYHVGADVYPDGAVRPWEEESLVDAPGYPIEQDAKRLMDWDGHSQGHCGWHVSVFGCDHELVRAEAEAQVAHYQAKANGTCPGCQRTGPYKTDFYVDPEK